MKRQNPGRKPDLRGSCGNGSLHRKSDEFRRQTRLQARNEKQLNGFSSSIEVSIETLHSICAPTVLQQAKKSLQKQHSNKSKSRSTEPFNQFETASCDLFLSTKRHLFLTSEGHLPTESGLQAQKDGNETETKKCPYFSNIRESLSLEDQWLEVFVQVHDGINLVVDLNSNNIEDWLLEKHSLLLMHPGVIDDETLKQCCKDLATTDNPIAACFASNNIEAPSTNTTANNSRLSTCWNALDFDAGSQSAPTEVLGGCVASGNIADVMESQESCNTEAADDRSNRGLDFGSLVRMPTFFGTAVRRLAEESKGTCNSNCTVAYVLA